MAGLVAIIIAAGMVLSAKHDALRRFDADPSCAANSPESRGAVPAGDCMLRQIRIANTWAGSVGRSGTAHYIAYIDDSGINHTAQIVHEDSVFVQMFHPDDETTAVYYQGTPIRIAFRQYWVTTEDDPHRAMRKTIILAAIVLALYVVVAGTVYLRTP